MVVKTDLNLLLNREEIANTQQLADYAYKHEDSSLDVVSHYWLWLPVNPAAPRVHIFHLPVSSILLISLLEVQIISKSLQRNGPYASNLVHSLPMQPASSAKRHHLSGSFELQRSNRTNKLFIHMCLAKESPQWVVVLKESVKCIGLM